MVKFSSLFYGAAALVAVSAQGVPTFPDQWNSDVASKLLLWQGGTHNSTDGSACCPKEAPQCKVQAEAQLGTQFSDSKNNRTALQVGGQAIISLYSGKGAGKEYLVEPSKSGSGWTCQSYCPLQNTEYFNPLTFDPSAKDLGKAKLPNGQTYEHWQWQDKILKVISMDTQDWFITPGANPKPYLNTEALTPFGGAQIAEESTEFDNFAAGLGKFDFTIDNLDSCQESDKCQQDSSMVSNFLKKHLKNKAQNRRSLLEKAEGMVKESMEMKFVGTSTEKKESAANFPKDWTATVTNTMLINQGGQPGPDGSLCCASSYSGQCQIQSQYQNGLKYFDFTNQRVRTEDPVNGIIVSLYGKDGKNMLVVHNGTHDVCEKYCPIDPRDTLPGGNDYFLDPNATDLGKTTYKGQSAEHYQWKETFLKVITMQTTDFYAATADDTPLGAESKLTPFGGPQIGSQSTTWANFKAGTPPASKFDIQGIDTCPQDPQCGQQQHQARRLADKQFHTFAQYHYV